WTRWRWLSRARCWPRSSHRTRRSATTTSAATGVLLRSPRLDHSFALALVVIADSLRHARDPAQGGQPVADLEDIVPLHPGGGLGDEHGPLVGDGVHDVHLLVGEVEVLGTAVIIIGLPVHEAVVDEAADGGGDVGSAEEAQPGDLGNT